MLFKLLMLILNQMASVTFNIFQKLSSLNGRRHENKEMSTQVKNSENILREVQKIIIWDDPFFSCCCVILVNIVFWLIIYLNLKFYGLIFTLLLILTFEQLWFEHISTFFYKSKEQNPVSDSEDRTFTLAKLNILFQRSCIALKQSITKAKLLRQSQPGKFCITACLCFLVLAGIGRFLSSVLGFYFLLMCIMTVPGVLNHFLPPHFLKKLSELFFSSHKETTSDNDEEIEPYLPDTSEEALELLRLAGDLQQSKIGDDEDSNDALLERISEHASDTTESVSSKFSLCPETVSMPSPENSMDAWEFDLSLGVKSNNNEQNNGINFQSSHFDGDSSEEEFIQGLDLTKENSKATKNFRTQKNDLALTTNKLISIGKKFLENELKQGERKTGNDKESSSDTDSFELISEEDM